MRLGKEYRIDEVSASDLAAFATDIGVRPGLVANELERLVIEAETAWDEISTLRELEPYDNTVARMREGWARCAARLSRPAR